MPFSHTALFLRWASPSPSRLRLSVGYLWVWLSPLLHGCGAVGTIPPTRVGQVTAASICFLRSSNHHSEGANGQSPLNLTTLLLDQPRLGSIRSESLWQSRHVKNVMLQHYTSEPFSRQKELSVQRPVIEQCSGGPLFLEYRNLRSGQLFGPTTSFSRARSNNGPTCRCFDTHL